jgi:hypothetical protein
MDVKLGLSPIRVLREKLKLSVEFRALRRIFGPKRDEVTVEWRKSYNEELNGVSNRTIE